MGCGRSKQKRTLQVYGSNEAGLVQSWRMTLRLRYLLLAASVLALAGQGLAQGCEGWNTSLFFLSATPAEVESCLAAGAEVNARATVLGHTPLHLAAQFNNNPAVIEVLLDAGADLKAQDLSGNTPWDYAKDREELIDSDAYRRLSEAQELAAACEEWDRDTLGFFISATPAEVQECLNAGADVNTRDEYGNTPLHWATRYSDISAPITVALIEAGADVNAQDDEGKTPLHEAAARSGGRAIIEALIEAGADATVRDDEGKTPWGHARSGDAYRILGEALGLPAECAEWSTPEFFETATPAEVRACFPARGDANTDGHGLPPCTMRLRISTTPPSSGHWSRLGRR